MNEIKTIAPMFVSLSFMLLSLAAATASGRRTDADVRIWENRLLRRGDQEPNATLSIYERVARNLVTRNDFMRFHRKRVIDCRETAYLEASNDVFINVSSMYYAQMTGNFRQALLYPYNNKMLACGVSTIDLYVSCNTAGNYYEFVNSDTRLEYPYVYEVCAHPFAKHYMPNFTVQTPPHVACAMADPDVVQVGSALIVDCPEGKAKYVCGHDGLYHLVVDAEGTFLEDVDAHYLPHTLEMDKVCREPGRYYSRENGNLYTYSVPTQREEEGDEVAVLVWIATAVVVAVLASLVGVGVAYGIRALLARKTQRQQQVDITKEEPIYENVTLKRIDSLMLKCRDFMMAKRTEL